MKTNVKALARAVGKALKKKAPVIGIVAAVATGAATVVMTAKKAVEAKEIVDEQTFLKQEETGDPSATLTPKEIFMAVWKKFIVVAILYAIQAALILSAMGVTNHRYQSLLAAYGVMASAHEDYVEKVIDTIGEDKEIDIRKAISKDRVKEIDKATNVENRIRTGHGDTLFVDLLSGYEFYSSQEFLKSVQNTLNKRMLDEVTYGIFNEDATLLVNDYYDEVGLPKNKLGEIMCWRYEASRDNRCFIDLIFVPTFASDGITPAVGVAHRNEPMQVVDY